MASPSAKHRAEGNELFKKADSPGLAPVLRRRSLAAAAAKYAEARAAAESDEDLAAAFKNLGVCGARALLDDADDAGASDDIGPLTRGAFDVYQQLLMAWRHGEACGKEQAWLDDVLNRAEQLVDRASTAAAREGGGGGCGAQHPPGGASPGAVRRRALLEALASKCSPEWGLFATPIARALFEVANVHFQYVIKLIDEARPRALPQAWVDEEEEEEEEGEANDEDDESEDEDEGGEEAEKGEGSDDEAKAAKAAVKAAKEASKAARVAARASMKAAKEAEAAAKVAAKAVAKAAAKAATSETIAAALKAADARALSVGRPMLARATALAARARVLVGEAPCILLREIADLQQSLDVHRAILDSRLARMRGQAQLDKAMESLGSPNTVGAEMALDSFSEARAVARGLDAESEAMALSKIGFVFLKVLPLVERAAERAGKAFTQSLVLAHSAGCEGRDFSRVSWYVLARTEAQAYQERKNAAERAEAERVATQFLGPLKKECDAIEAAHRRGALELLKHVYEHHKPRNPETNVCGDTGDLKAAVRSAVIHCASRAAPRRAVAAPRRAALRHY